MRRKRLLEMNNEHRQFEWIILYYANLGEMPEWSNGPVSKSGVCHRTEGSNPSLSLKQKAKPQGFAFCFTRKLAMRTLGEGSIDRARAKRTQRGQGLRPPAVTRRARCETKWASCPIPLSYWERGVSCIEREGNAGEGNEVTESSNPSLVLREESFSPRRRALSYWGMGTLYSERGRWLFWKKNTPSKLFFDVKKEVTLPFLGTENFDETPRRRFDWPHESKIFSKIGTFYPIFCAKCHILW